MRSALGGSSLPVVRRCKGLTHTCSQCFSCREAKAARCDKKDSPCHPQSHFKMLRRWEGWFIKQKQSPWEPHQLSESEPQNPRKTLYSCRPNTSRVRWRQETRGPASLWYTERQKENHLTKVKAMTSSRKWPLWLPHTPRACTHQSNAVRADSMACCQRDKSLTDNVWSVGQGPFISTLVIHS